MPALTPTNHYGTIAWLGLVPDRNASLTSVAAHTVRAVYSGFEGEAHGGLTRPSCSRMAMLHPKGTEIRNTRQMSVLSTEEMAEIAAAMGLDHLDPGLLGASMLVTGIPDFTHIPPSSRLQAGNGTTLVVDLENGPCIWPGKEVERLHKGFGARFKPAAEDRRGITGWVEREGALSVGDKLRLFVPAQRPWSKF